MSSSHEDPRSAWIARVLGVDVTTGAAPAAPTLNDLTIRLQELVIKVRAVGAPPDLMDDLRSAGVALKGNDLVQAASLMDAMDARLSTARADAAAAEIAAAAPSAKVGVVAFAKIRLRWAAARNAHREAIENMHAACDAVLADPDAADDPQFEDMQAAAAEVGELMPPVPADIDKHIDDMATSDTDKRDAARKQALAAIGGFRAALEKEPALKGLQDLPSGKFAIHDKIMSALNDLEDALAA